jgi:high-affinity nickel permease
MIPQTYIIPNQYKGDTFGGVQFTLTNTTVSSPIDLTGSTIECKFRKTSPTGILVKTISDGSGITIVDAVNGIFKIDAFDVDFSANIYYYDIQITDATNIIITYVRGTLTVTQDITYG